MEIPEQDHETTAVTGCAPALPSGDTRIYKRKSMSASLFALLWTAALRGKLAALGLAAPWIPAISCKGKNPVAPPRSATE